MHDAGLDLERHDRNRRVLGARLSDVGLHRHRQRVVAAVVATLDLDDAALAREGAGGLDRVHVGFGTGVGEPDLLKVEPPLEALCDLRRRRRGRDEQCARVQRLGHVFDHGGVEVADQHRTETHGEVEHVATVDVLEPGALGALDRDGVRVPVLEGRRDAKRQRDRGTLVMGSGGGRLGREALPLRGHELLDARLVDRRG